MSIAHYRLYIYYIALPNIRRAGTPKRATDPFSPIPIVTPHKVHTYTRKIRKNHERIWRTHTIPAVVRLERWCRKRAPCASLLCISILSPWLLDTRTFHDAWDAPCPDITTTTTTTTPSTAVHRIVKSTRGAFCRQLKKDKKRAAAVAQL